MLRKGIAIAALLLVPTLAKAQVENPWEMTLGGGAANSADFDGFTGSINGSIGYYFTPELELSLRQNVQYSDLVGSDWNGSTRIALDYHFRLGDRGQWQPFIGANVGYVYGDSISDTWEAAPEAGVKYYVNSSTFIFAQVEYQFFFDEAEGADDAFEDGQFLWSLGIGFRF